MSEQSNSLPWVVCLMGPTASGKTQLAMDLSRSFPITLISVDSTQVYRGLDIGAGKPTQQELIEYPHALIDVAEPTTPYNAHQFCQDAQEAIKQAHLKGTIPLLVGGTMLYFKALVQGMSDLPGASMEVRQEIEQQAAILGWPAMHAQLSQIDPITAARLQPTDAQRIERALEIFYATQKPMSYWIAQPSSHSFPYRVLNIALFPDDSQRFKLHERIECRFKKMLDQGLISEVKKLMQQPGYDPNLPAFRSVGYRQTIEHLEGLFDYAMLIEKGVAATRQLAKRQLTWLRTWSDCYRMDCFDPELESKVSVMIKQRIERK